MKGRQEDTATMRVTTLRFPVDQYERLKLIAKANQRTVSQEMRFLIDRRIAETERKAA